MGHSDLCVRTEEVEKALELGGRLGLDTIGLIVPLINWPISRNSGRSGTGGRSPAWLSGLRSNQKSTASSKKLSIASGEALRL
jgi:hypothetical protein